LIHPKRTISAHQRAGWFPQILNLENLELLVNEKVAQLKALSVAWPVAG
jgi:hypothetical protein